MDTIIVLYKVYILITTVLHIDQMMKSNRPGSEPCKEVNRTGRQNPNADLVEIKERATRKTLVLKTDEYITFTLAEPESPMYRDVDPVPVKISLVTR